MEGHNYGEDIYDDSDDDNEYDIEQQQLIDLLFNEDEFFKNQRYNSKDYIKWTNIFKNSYSVKLERNKKQKTSSTSTSNNDGFTNKENYKKKKNLMLDFMFSWFLRMKNVHLMPRKIIQFSILLYNQGCPSKIWKILSMLRLSLSLEKTKELLNRGSQLDIPLLLKWPKNPTFIEIGADNCAYYNGTPIIRDQKKSHFINSINWYEKFPNISLEQIPNTLLNFQNDYNTNFEAFR